MQYLSFDLSCDADGVTTLEALASTAAEQHAAVMAEVQQVLDWAWQHYPHSHGPVDDGMDWDDDLQVQVEDGRWHAVSLTLAGSPRFIEAFFAAFGPPQD
ncbi:MAG: hypothetical protein H7242_18965 [Microbacteriaceae bacterium]|nr:hypothetical protein [Burkholderiaceae bacterium]